MNSIALLAEIIAQGGKPSASFYRDSPAFDPLVRDGFLYEAGVLGSVLCDDCEDAHAAQVVFYDGSYGYTCPDLGFVTLDQADISAIKPDIPHLVASLADAFDCTKCKSTAIHSQTWRIGSVKTETDEFMLYFHPRLHAEDDAHDLEQALSREVRSPWRLIVSASGTLKVAGAQVVTLTDLVELEAESGGFQVLARPEDFFGMPNRHKGGRPNQFTADLIALEARREQRGESLDGRNKQADALLADFKQMYPGRQSPTISTVRQFVTTSRNGQ